MIGEDFIIVPGLQQDFWYFLPIYICFLAWQLSVLQRKKPVIMHGIVIFGLVVSILLLLLLIWVTP